MSYLLIAFIVLVALAPLFHFVPSKRQRKVAQLREFAALQGLFVEFREVPSRAGAVQYLGRQSDGNTIYYGKRIPATGRRLELSRASWIHGAYGWQGKSRKMPVPDALEGLPEGILAVSLDENSCGIYWREAGGLAEIEQIQAVLEQLVMEISQPK